MILITGASGFVGRALVTRLVTEGYTVRVLAATPAKLTFPIDLGARLQIVKGSLDDPVSLHQAMTGVHTVFHLASAQWWGRRRDLEQIDIGGTRQIITAGRSARVGRLIILSHLGAAPSSAYTLMRIKGQVEELVKASGIAYSIYRSGIVYGPDDSFVNGIAGMLRVSPLLFFQPGEGENLLHPIYIHDLVEALVRGLEALHIVDQTVEIGGPEYVTFNEMVRTIMRVTRTPRAVVSVSPVALRALASGINTVFPRWPMTPQWLDILAANRTASLRNLYDLFEIRGVRFEDTLLTYMQGRNFVLELLKSRRSRGT
jgi:NADH dehydrogenase